MTLEEFSLERFTERIHYGKTKDYFAEVLSSYHNDNYRSSVVMLWSVIVCDLVYKLQHLVDLYSDASVRNILNEMTALQNADPKSSAWEIKLLDETFEKTNLLNSSEYENLKHIQKQRHLSAHPVLNHNRELYSPNKETVRSLLRNALEGLLIKPPFYAQRILNELLDDIAENTSALNTRKKVKQYVESRYLSRMSSDVELSIYRSIWKLVFKLVNDECNKNRDINLQTLEVISERNKTHLPEIINGERDYYSNIAATGSPVEFLAFYLSTNSNLYELLNDDAKLKIKHCIETDYVGKIVGWFVKDSLEQHFNDLIEWIQSDEHPNFDQDHWEFLLALSDTEEWQEHFCKLISTYYTASKSYNQADERFNQAIQPFLHLFNLDTLTFLLTKIETNNQTYRRGRSASDHPLIENRILELASDFDFSLYSKFESTIEVDDDDE